MRSVRRDTVDFGPHDSRCHSGHGHRHRPGRLRRDAGASLIPAAAVAPAWQAPLPHGGRLVELDQWWAQFDDPLMARLVTAAEGVSPSIASAGARIAEARATRVGAEAALLPQVNATASASRGRPDLALPLATASNAGLQASWELDVFGGNRAGRSAAEARLAGAEATWHDARVIVAAETANQYLGLRACQARLVQTQLDAELARRNRAPHRAEHGKRLRVAR